MSGKYTPALAPVAKALSDLIEATGAALAGELSPAEEAAVTWVRQRAALLYVPDAWQVETLDAAYRHARPVMTGIDFARECALAGVSLSVRNAP